MGKGLDLNQRLTQAQARNLKAAGYTFVARYINPDKSQCLSKAEAHVIAGEGLAIVSIWEKGNPTGPEYFTAERGRADGLGALAAANNLRQPHSKPIYFAVDYDASAEECKSHIQPYFVALRLALQPVFMAGVYGSGLVLAYLKGAGLSSYLWQADPRGWAGYTTVVTPQLRQTTNDTNLMGLQVDIDASNGNAGGWLPVPA